jgi:glutaconate CoA-transferase, subunit B
MSDEPKRVLRAGSDPLVFFRYPGGEEGPGYSKGHIMAAAMAAALRDGETVVLGANGMLPLAAARLAQMTHAPDLTIISGASGGVNSLVEPLVPSSGDYANLVAEAVLPFQDVISLQMSGRTDVFFAGGVEIDGSGGEPSRSRGPGSAGLPWAQRSRRILLYTTSHRRSVLVPWVEFISLPGWTADDRERGRPELLVTPLAVFRFSENGAEVASVHPGVEPETVKERTGFDLRWPEGEVPRTPAPTDVQMRLMREFDPDGLLAIVAGD